MAACLDGAGQERQRIFSRIAKVGGGAAKVGCLILAVPSYQFDASSQLALTIAHCWKILNGIAGELTRIETTQRSKKTRKEMRS